MQALSSRTSVSTRSDLASGPIAVLKFGSSLLKDPGDLPTVAAEIRRWTQGGARVVAVVSAFRGETDALLAHGRQVGGEAALGHSLATLVALGEARAAALLALALGRQGVSARAMTARDMGLVVRGSALDADPCKMRPAAILRELARAPAVVVPGFVGCDRRGRLALLGRGGSDLTAIALAGALEAKVCRLLKDVDGIYDDDPARGRACHLDHISFDQARHCAGRAIQPKALDYAQAHDVAFEVARPGGGRLTRVDALAPPVRSRGEL